MRLLRRSVACGSLASRNDKMTTEDLQKLTVFLRLEILEMIYRAGKGYIGGSLSALDILAALYFGQVNGLPVLKYDPKRPQWNGADHCILSKAHSAPAWYAVLAEAGFFPKSELESFASSGALLRTFPYMKIPGVTLAPGSISQGLSLAVGLAAAFKMDRKPNRVYVLLGDGELQNGQIWESALFAAHHKLDNLVAFVDVNGFSGDGLVREILSIEPLQDKFEAFGWKVIRVLDGNNISQILDAVSKAWKVLRMPCVLLAHTVKGKGVPFFEKKSFYHKGVLSEQEMVAAREELARQI